MFIPPLWGSKKESISWENDNWYNCQSWFFFLSGTSLPDFFKSKSSDWKTAPICGTPSIPKAPGCIDPRTAWGSWPFARSSHRQRWAQRSWETERRVPGVWRLPARSPYGRYTNKPSMALHGYRRNHTIYVNIIYISMIYIYIYMIYRLVLNTHWLCVRMYIVYINYIISHPVSR